MDLKAFPKLSSVAELGALIREGCPGAPSRLCRRGRPTGFAGGDRVGRTNRDYRIELGAGTG